MNAEQLKLFFQVFDWVALSYAVATGIAFGATVILYITLRYPPKLPITTRRLAVVVGLATASAGTLFFAGQVAQALATDPLWPRAAARMALWEVFSVAIAVGLGVARSFAHR